MKKIMGRIGVLIPAANTTMEEELPRYCPNGIALNFNRMSRHPSGSENWTDALLSLDAAAERAATDLAYTRPDIVLFGCTSGSFILGPGNEARPGETITRATGIRAITTAMAVIDALRGFEAKRVHVLTPYPTDISMEAVRFLKHYGFETSRLDTFGCTTGPEIAAIPSSRVFERLASDAAEVRKNDAVFISCTALHTMDQIAKLEDTLGIPVVSSNQASLWACLRMLGVGTEGVKAGSLFDRGALH